MLQTLDDYSLRQRGAGCLTSNRFGNPRSPSATSLLGEIVTQAQHLAQRPSETIGQPRRAIRAAETLIAVAAGIFVVGVVVGLLVVGRHGGGPIQGWDNMVERWFPSHRGPLVGMSKFVATYLDAVPLAVICVVLSAVLAVTLRSIRALIPIVAYLGGEFQVFAIRQVILRHRPPTADYPAAGAVKGVHETSYSFPSGHSVAVTAVLFALLGTVALTYRIWWPWLLAFVGSLFVVDTRLILGVHWFSDVTFGLIFGITWGVTVAIVARQATHADTPVDLVAVNPAYTSLRCSGCGHVAKENRESQAVFHCQACGYTGNADVNAAVNILAAGQVATGRGGTPPAPPTAPSQPVDKAQRPDEASTTRELVPA